MQGMVMGGAIGGIYGAGGGLVLGLLTGFFTADSHYAQRNTQIQAEQQKDKLLEAQIEQELERNRQLEARLLGSAADPTGQSQPPATERDGGSTGSGLAATAVTSPDRLASLRKPELPAQPAHRPFKNVEAKDVNGDGVPDLWIYFNPSKPGEIVRQEESTNGDGRVDTWSYFRDGKLVRREIDSRRKGMADTFYFYENDTLIREERDELGRGFANHRAFYQNGRLAKVEKDSTGSGKTDRWVYYDPSQSDEIVIREEQDLNGDGMVDMWSHYENGLLARRDLSAVGLELLSQKDSPAASVDPKPTYSTKPRGQRS